MRLLEYTLLTVVVAFIIQFWVLSAITSDKPQPTMGKFYLSMVSACIMGILEVMIHDTYKSVVSLFYYLVLGVSLYLFIYFFKNSWWINDADYLKQMLKMNFLIYSDVPSRSTSSLEQLFANRPGQTTCMYLDSSLKIGSRVFPGSCLLIMVHKFLFFNWVVET